MEENINLFKNFYKEGKEKLNKKIEEFNCLSDDNKLVDQNIKLFTNLNSDGKLIRGTLVNLGYNLICNDNLDYSYPLALAFEIFQTAILVHDDVIDNDCLRRGKDTIHYSNYKKYYNLTKKEDDSKKISDSIAICMGDMGLYEANQVIAKNYCDASNLGEILIKFNDIVIKTIKGELIDVTLPFIEMNNLDNIDLEENIMTIYRLKTAWYTIIGPLSLGMILASADAKKVEDIEKFGLNVGIAFQIQDDILGIFSNDQLLGKTVGSDIEEFKQTILYSYVKEKKIYYNELMNLYGKKIKKDNIKQVQDIFIKSGALDYANNYVDKLYNEAIDLLNNITWLEDDKLKLLIGFVYYLKDRKK